MIHYHGTPIGGSKDNTCRFLQGRHALVPFKRPDDLSAVIEFCQSFVLDNSAFSYWRAGEGDVDVPSYHAWVNSLAGLPSLDWCLIPDKIDGNEEKNKELVTLWLRMGCKVKSVPIWHLHESLEWLEWLVNNFEIIALGSSGQWASPGTSGWWNRMSDAMKVICDNNGVAKCKLHGLRMLDPEIFTKLPLASADSTNAAVNSGSLQRFGSYVPVSSAQRAAVIADRIESYNAATHYAGKPESNNLFDL